MFRKHLSLFLILLTGIVGMSAQDLRTIRGLVADENGQAIGAATLKVEGYTSVTLDATAGFLLFKAGCILSQIVDLKESSFMIDWIPWTLTGYAIVLISTIGTTVRVRKKWILLSIALGVVSMLIWDLIFVRMGTDYRTLLLLSHVVFSVGLALSVAQDSPRSERYFLQGQGPPHRQERASLSRQIHRHRHHRLHLPRKGRIGADRAGVIPPF